MRSPKNLLILFLSLTTAGAVALAWRQYQELITLRAGALAVEQRFSQEAAHAAAFDSRPAEAQPATESSGDLPAPAGENVASSPPEVAPGAPDRSPRGFGRARGIDSPEVQQLIALQRKAGLDGRYAALFKTLNLSPEQLERFKDLLVEHSTVRQDVMAAARAQGVNPRTDRDTLDALIADGASQIEATIRAELGETAYAQYKDYERTLPQRGTVNQLEQRLSYSSTPLSREQSEAMVRILAQSTSVTDGRPRSLGAVSDVALEQARGVLAAPQLDALRQLQQEQRTQAEMSSAMRRQFERDRPATSPTTTAPGSSPGGQPKG